MWGERVSRHSLKVKPLAIIAEEGIILVIQVGYTLYNNNATLTLL